jgi:hypothetical protein
LCCTHFAATEYVVDYVFETVDQALARSGLRLLTAQRASYRNRFTPFVATLLSRATVRTPTLLVALVYIARARPHLAIPSARRAPESVFLGALIVAAKYTNDSALRNAHWARFSSGVFGVRDVGRIEREFLAVLDWELGVAEADLLGLPRREEMVAAAARAVCPSVESASTLTSVEEDTDHPFLRPLQRHHRRSSSARSGPVPDLLPSSAFASPASSAGTASPPTPPPPVFTVIVLDVAEYPRALTNSKKGERETRRGRLSALLHGHWHVFHHGHRTGVGQVV